MKKKGLLLILIIILIVALVYYLFFYSKNCEDEACFSQALLKCEKANYLNDAEDASWFYTIKGKQKEECIISVKLLQAKKGDVELDKLKNLDMDCSLPLGFVGSPQADLARCHGLLKEALQEIMIKNMHAYILSNLGEVDGALKSVL